MPARQSLEVNDMYEEKIRGILSEILSDDATEKITKSILGELKKKIKLSEEKIISFLPKMLSDDVKSNLASKIIYEMNKTKPIMIEQISVHFPDFLDEEVKTKLAEDIIEKIQTNKEISVNVISKILPDVLAKKTKSKISQEIFESIRKMRARRITVSDISKLKPADISPDNIYNIGGLQGLVVKKNADEEEWNFGYDGDSSLAHMLREKIRKGNPKMCRVVMRSVMEEERMYLFTDSFGNKDPDDSNYKSGLFREFEFLQGIRIKVSPDGDVWVSRNNGEFEKAGYVNDSEEVFVSMFKLSCK